MKPTGSKILAVCLGATLALLFVSLVWRTPLMVLMVLVPASLACAGAALVAAFLPGRRAPLLYLGLKLLMAVGVLTLSLFLISAGDWVHVLWNVEFPLVLMFSGAGLLLVRVWPEERRQLARTNGAAVALLAIAGLGSIPFLIAVSPIEPRPTDNMEISPVPALVEAARYGFGGDLPLFLQTESSPRYPGAPTHPPRSATVTMAALALAAGTWILFVVISLLGRALPAGEARWKFLLLSPPIAALTLVYLFNSKSWNPGIWENELLLPKAFGPLLLAAGLAALILFAAVRLDRRRTPAPA